MKFLLVFVFAAFLAFAGPEKLDPVLKAFLDAPAETKPALLSLYGEELASDAHLPLFLELKPSATLSIPGLRSRVGNLATAVLPLSQILELSERPEVVRIWAGRPVEPFLDISVPEVGAPALWYSPPYTTGEGAIVGLVDSGVDILHPAFRVDREGDGTFEGSRILFYWDQTEGQTGWLPPFWGDDPGEGVYGRGYSQRDLEAAIAANFSPAPDTLGHGTHVAGIAAGGPAAGRPGVAPGANLVVVKTNFYETGVVDAINFICEAGKYLGKPVVVNLSLGGHAGPHDGTGPFERMIAALVTGPGRIIVAAAGNEGEAKIHVGREVTTKTTWTLVPTAPAVMVRLWYTLPARFTVTVTSPRGESLVVLPGQARALTTPMGTLWLDNSGDSLNQTQQIFLSLTGAAHSTRWTITLDPIFPGRVDGWIESPSMGFFLEGDGQMTIAEPGNVEGVITVGAYVTRGSWESQLGWYYPEGYELQELAPFSSRGPTRDGRLKPDLAAPGAWIVSARSREAQVSPWYALPDGLHTVLAGTSMSAPHVAGACALLLSLRPNLSWREILAALQKGARVDRYVGAVPNPRWGAGKLDLVGARVALGPPPPSEKPTLVLLANPVATNASFHYALPREAIWAELRVYDLLGRLVWRMELDRGGETARWDLRSLSGAKVSSGLYLAVLVTDRGSSPPVRVVVSR